MEKQAIGHRILVDFSCDILQEIRLIHAVSESAWQVVIPERLAPRFSLLKREFGMNFQIGDVGDISFKSVSQIHHMEPVTAIGDISKPLIFPKGISAKCRAFWEPRRPHRFTFAGLLNADRMTALSRWVKFNTGSDLPYLELKETLRWLPCRIRNLFPARPKCLEWKAGEFQLKSSDRGRKFPGKTWDEQYYKFLGESQFVLCPKGDCVWSYRFFEAILCGAIPIIEENCPAFEGFQFKSFSDPAETLHWSEEIAEANYKLCVERLTVEEGEIENALSRLLKRG